jgi:hypothetical protein
MEGSLLGPLLFLPLVILFGLNRPDPGDKSSNQNDSCRKNNKKVVVFIAVIKRRDTKEQS